VRSRGGDGARRERQAPLLIRRPAGLAPLEADPMPYALCPMPYALCPTWPFFTTITCSHQGVREELATPVLDWRCARAQGAGCRVSVVDLVGCDLAGEMVRAAKDKRLYSSVAQQVSLPFPHAESNLE
jgi:hypothetical protein